MHLVELDLEIGDAGARFLARFEFRRNSPQLFCSARSSSSVASKPSLIRRLRQQGRRFLAQRAAQQVERGFRNRQVGADLRQQCGFRVGERSVQRGRAARLSRSDERSRGRALFSAMRAVMRSMSLIPLKVLRSGQARSASISSATARWRCAARLRSASG